MWQHVAINPHHVYAVYNNVIHCAYGRKQIIVYITLNYPRSMSRCIHRLQVFQRVSMLFKDFFKCLFGFFSVWKRFSLWLQSLTGVMFLSCPTALGFSRTSGSKGLGELQSFRTKLDLKVPLIPSLDLIPESSSAPARFWFQEVLLQIDADSCSALIPRDNKKLTSTMCTEGRWDL